MLIKNKSECSDENIPLNELPFKSKFRALLFYGTADGSSLSKAFDVEDIKRSLIVIKSFRIIPYTVAAVKDFFVEDSGATEQWTETIPANCRINRVFDLYNLGARIDFLINDVPLFFQTKDSSGVPVDGYPVDLFIDNIYFKYPERIVELDLKITAKVFTDLLAGTTANPLVKVIVECYLI